MDYCKHRSVWAKGHWQCHGHIHRTVTGDLAQCLELDWSITLFTSTQQPSDVAGPQHKASWDTIVIVFSVFDMVNVVPLG